MKRKYRNQDDEENSESDDEEEKIINLKVIGTHIYFYSLITDRSCFLLHTSIKKCLHRHKKKQRLTIHIHTRGGNIEPALAIYDLLRSMPQYVTIIVEGLCASAGLVLLLAGDKRLMRKHTSLLIHHVSTHYNGQMNVLEVKDALHNTDLVNEQALSIYIHKTKLTKEELLHLMAHDTQFSAQQAKEYGFIDEVI